MASSLPNSKVILTGMSKQSSAIPAIIRQLRPHQWVKNLLLFVPIFLAHHLLDADALLHVVLGVVCFSLAASAIYTINDIADVESDRQHPQKRHRPVAAGEISVGSAWLTAVVLLAATAGLSSLMMPPAFAIWMIVYVAATLAYTYVFKKMVLVDVLVLAGLYTLRVAAGGAAAAVVVSPWLLAFGLFLFTSLAFLKRHAELSATIEREGRHISGRGYHVGDVHFILVAGPSLGFLALLVFTLYLQSPEVRQLYPNPNVMWALVPCMMYWISRLWLKAHRGEMHEDPILYAVRDGASYAVAAIILGIITLARFA